MNEIGGLRAAVEQTEAWLVYSKEPGPKAFERLLAHTARLPEAGEGGSELLPSLQNLLERSQNWKVAQHIGLILLRGNHSLYFEYFAQRALNLSGGDVFARMPLAIAFWRRRLPAAVRYQTGILRIQARRVKPPSRRRILLLNIAQLHCMCAAYERNRAELARWFRYLRHQRAATFETLERIAVAFNAGSAPPEAIEAAILLGLSKGIHPSPRRAYGRVRLVLQRALVELLRSRP